MATCNVNTLLANGKAFQELSKRDLQIAICQLLCEIKAGGGGGGSGQIVAYTGTDPNSDGVVPAAQNMPAIAVKPSSTTYTWDTVGLTWT